MQREDRTVFLPRYPKPMSPPSPKIKPLMGPIDFQALSRQFHAGYALRAPVPALKMSSHFALYPQPSTNYQFNSGFPSVTRLPNTTLKASPDLRNCKAFSWVIRPNNRSTCCTNAFLPGRISDHHCSGSLPAALPAACPSRSEEHTSELQSRFGISYAV